MNPVGYKVQKKIHTLLKYSFNSITCDELTFLRITVNNYEILNTYVFLHFYFFFFFQIKPLSFVLILVYPGTSMKISEIIGI